MASADLALPPRLILPGIEAFVRGGRPAVPSTDDGNWWEDGLCWLYCGEWARVMWIGPVTVASATAPMRACAACIRRLHDMVWEHLLLKDSGSQEPELPLPEAPMAQRVVEARSLPRHRARRRRSVLDRWRNGWRRRVRDREAR
ncbi:hypothetical protein OHV05_36980 (plasmid) [Kitasatospora sp. NBC_00070]|uniref:hypothetical protein n=1 Tax=Kitasatospora sp. NBC_00070 TaxID=2975962 RepID=UPI002F9123FE